MDKMRTLRIVSNCIRSLRMNNLSLQTRNMTRIYTGVLKTGSPVGIMS